MERALRVGALIVVTALAVGCGPSRPGGRDRDGGGISLYDGQTSRDGAGGNSCIDAARWVYVVDSSRQLLRFEPADLRFTSIGTLDCPGGSSPFSMAVDRDARAWVLHQDRRIYWVSTTDASCTTTDFVPGQEGLELFGMGFVSDTAGSDDETLFVAGGAELSIASGSATLGRVDDVSLALSSIGDIPGWPELTGTGAGELWGFFPDSTPPSVRRLDPASGASLETFDFDAISGTTPSAWAFAFWGGRFYVFLQTMDDPSTNVWRLDPSTGVFEQVLSNTGYRIVGAGVSTCAPVDLI